jgi:hypothetical protein
MGASIMDILARGNVGPSDLDLQQQRAGIQHAQAATQQAQTQTAGLAIQNKLSERDLRDQDIMQRAMANTNGDPLAVKQYASKNGISAPGYFALQGHINTAQTQAATLTKDQLANESATHQQTGDILQAIQAAPPEQRAAAWTSALPQLQALEPKQPWEAIAPDDNRLKYYLGTHGFTGKLLEQANKSADTADKLAGIPKKQADTDLANTSAAKINAELPGVQADAQIKVAQQRAMKNMNPQTVDAQIDATIPGGRSAFYGEQNNTAKQAAHAAIAAGATPLQVQAVIKDASDRIMHMNAGVEQAKATAPTRISVMQAGVQARAASAIPGDDALNMAAESALAGTMPSSRNASYYSAVMNRAAEIAKGRGMDAQGAIMARNGAQAAKSAYTSITKQYETLKPFADMAEKNANVLEGITKQVSDLGAPVLNTPIRLLQSKFGGNTKVAALTAALLPVQADFARILNSPTGNGVLSDNARKEMEAALSPGGTVGQIKAALDVFRKDAHNRKESYEASLSDLSARTVSGGQGTPKSATATPIASQYKVGDPVMYNGAPHKIKEIKANGKLVLEN